MTTEPTIRLSIRVSHDLLATLKGLAGRYDRSPSHIAAWLLEAGVSDYYERRAKGLIPDPPAVRPRVPADPEVRLARASKGGKSGGVGRGKNRRNGNG